MLRLSIGGCGGGACVPALPPGPPKAGIRLGPPAVVHGSAASLAGLPLDVPWPLPLRTGSAWVGGPSVAEPRPFPRSQPLPAGSQLLPAGLPPWAGPPWAPFAGAPFAGASGPDWPGLAGAPGEPEFAAGVKDGGAGVPGVVGENLGIRAAAVAWEAALGPWAGAVAVGADSDAAGPKSSASNRRSRPSGGATSGAATVSGSQISAVRPPACACRSRTRTPCRAARRPTTNRPIRRDTATSTPGGLSRRQLACDIS